VQALGASYHATALDHRVKDAQVLKLHRFSKSSRICYINWTYRFSVPILAVIAATSSPKRCEQAHQGRDMKLIYCLRRLPTLSLDEFQHYWFDVHGPLVLAHQVVLRIQRYIQVHTETGPLVDKVRAFRGSPEPYDGVAEIWYESREALETLGRDPEARGASRKLLEDERKFVDSARSPIWIGEERVVIEAC
jgi:uncharacterized protein (TIGR02118 family)